MEPTDNLIRIKEVPKKIPIAEKTLRNWRTQGLYPEFFVKIGGKVLVDMNEINNFIQKQKDTARKKNKGHDQD